MCTWLSADMPSILAFGVMYMHSCIHSFLPLALWESLLTIYINSHWPHQWLNASRLWITISVFFIKIKILILINFLKLILNNKISLIFWCWKFLQFFSKSLGQLIEFTLRKNHLWKFPIFLGGKNTDICPTKINLPRTLPYFPFFKN